MEAALAFISVPKFGAGSLGFVIGLLVWYFVFRYKDFSPKALGSTMSILTGGAVTKGFDWNASTDAVWYYPIGLFIATLIFWLTILAGPEGTEYLKDEALAKPSTGQPKP
jgi:hypothetical protein